jgi:hypothetical protein
MKKLFSLLFAMLLMAGLTTETLAGTVSLDLFSGGEYEYRSSSGTSIYDLPQTAISLDVPGREFKFACTLTSGTINDYDTDYGYADVDTASIFLKGGYALINKKRVRLDLTAGFFTREISWDYLLYSTILHDDIDHDSFYSFTIGFDAKVALNRRAWFDCSYSLGVHPQKERTYFISDSVTGDLDSISVTNFKFNYLFNRRIGLALGYYCENIDFNPYNNKDKYSSVTLGAFYRF